MEFLKKFFTYIFYWRLCNIRYFIFKRRDGLRFSHYIFSTPKWSTLRNNREAQKVINDHLDKDYEIAVEVEVSTRDGIRLYKEIEEMKKKNSVDALYGKGIHSK